MATMLFHWYNSLHAVQVVLILSFGLNFVWTSCLITVKISLDVAQFYSHNVDDQLFLLLLTKVS